MSTKKFAFELTGAGKRSIDGIPSILENIAIHFFGEQTNLVTFLDVKLPNYSAIDFVLARHRPFIAEIDDFVPVEFLVIPPDTAHLVSDISIRRFLSQVLVKGIIYEAWGVKSYWIIQESVYADLVEHFGLKPDGFSADHALRFALQDISAEMDGVKIKPARYISVSVNEIYQALRNDSGLPGKAQFIAALSNRIKRTLLSGVRMKVS
jgi:hypothetical protein